MPSPFKKSSSGGVAVEEGATESGSRKSSLKIRRGTGGEPPEKKERTDSPDVARSRSPVRKIELEEDFDSEMNDDVSKVLPPPGFVPEVDGSKPSSWIGQVTDLDPQVGDGGASGSGVNVGGISNEEKGSDQDKEELSLKSIMNAISDVNKNINSKFAEVDRKFVVIESAFETVQKELSEVKDKTVSKEVFNSLSVRVEKLEANSDEKFGSVMVSMRKQIARLDPANRSVRISGFSLTSVDERMKTVEKMLKDMNLPNLVSIDHIYKETSGQS